MDAHEIVDLEKITTPRVHPQAPLIHELFEAQVQRVPDAVAVAYEGQSLTYRQLNERANQLAHHLVAHGVGADELVGICVERGLEMVVGVLGVLKAGGAYVPLDPGYPTERLQYLLEDSAPRLVLTLSRVRARVEGTPAQVIELDGQWAEIERRPRANLPATVVGVRPEHLAYVIYTSGSTGKPKGVMVEHGHLVSSTVTRLNSYGSFGRFLLLSPLSFDSSVAGIFGTLTSAGTLVIASQEAARDLNLLSAAIRDFRITSLLCIASLYQRLLMLTGPELGRTELSRVMVAGEACPPTLPLESARCAPGVTLYNEYGPTECTVWTTVFECPPQDFPAGVPIGRPIAHARVYILDEQGQPVPEGVSGEICIGGAGVTRGYLNRPELTAERFITNPLTGNPRDRLYRTGDIGRFRADGHIEYLGRNDQQVKIRGYRIELGEIEAVLGSQPGVQQAAVLAREDEPGEKRLVAYVVLDGQQLVSQLRERLNQALPAHMVPAAIVVLKQMPLTPNGKLDRKALPAPGLDAYTTRQYEPPQGAIEEQLAEIWRELLRVERVGRMDNFFELGGHSLLGMKLITRIAASLQIPPGAMTIFRYPTVEQMARVVERLRAEAPTPAAPLTPRPAGNRAPLAFAQHWWWNLTQVDINGSLLSMPTALRVSGALQVAPLQAAFTELVRRHEALRTRIITSNGIREQEIAPFAGYDLEVVEVTRPSIEERERAAADIFEKLVAQRLDVSKDPMFVAKLLKLADDDHVLIVALDHLIADAASLVIVLRDIWTLYAQFERGLPASLPPMPIQLADYAVWQQENRESFLAAHGEHWDKRLSGAQRVRLFAEEKTTGHGFAAAPFRIGATAVTALRELSRQHQSTLAMSVLATWVTVVSRWCNIRDVVVPFVAMGRPAPELENTNGCFAAPLYLRIQLRPEDSFLDVLRRVTEEYATATEHDDLGYIGAQSPRPAFTYNCCFNWHPREFRIDPASSLTCIDVSQIEGLGGTLRVQPFAAEGSGEAQSHDMVWEDEPGLFLIEAEEGVVGVMLYRAERVGSETAQRVARSLEQFVDLMAAQPAARIETLACVS